MDQETFWKAVEYLHKELSPALVERLGRSLRITEEIGVTVRSLLNRSGIGFDEKWLDRNWREVLIGVIWLEPQAQCGTISKWKLRIAPIVGKVGVLPWLLARGQLHIEYFGRGETIFPENDRCKRVYMIKEGEVDVLSGGKSLAILRRGHIVGKLKCSGIPLSPGYYAKADCELIVLDHRGLSLLRDIVPDFHVYSILTGPVISSRTPPS